MACFRCIPKIYTERRFEIRKNPQQSSKLAINSASIISNVTELSSTKVSAYTTLWSYRPNKISSYANREAHCPAAIHALLPYCQPTLAPVLPTVSGE